MPGGGGGALAPYGAAKAGLNHMTRSLGRAWGRKVRVNCVSLGWVETEAMVDCCWRARDNASAKRDIPVGRMGTPEEIGGICVFLASPARRISTAPPSGPTAAAASERRCLITRSHQEAGVHV